MGKGLWDHPVGVTRGHYNHTTACSRAVVPRHALAFAWGSASVSFSLLTGLGCSLRLPWV